jgi:ferredoxin-type protein NapG
MEKQTGQRNSNPGQLFSARQILLSLPGAGDKEAFLKNCVGSGSCVEACPYGSVTMIPLGASRRIPAINPCESPCYLCDPAPCTEACKHDALQQVPLGQVRMGIANLDPVLCLRFAGKDCTLCYDSCPLRDVAIIWDEEIEAPLINLDKCTGCGVCMFKCPSEEKPISIEVFWNFTEMR